jgi:hypothetical protein
MALDASKIKVGPGRFYIDVTVPATGAALELTAGVPATGTELGLTDGEAVFTYEVEYFEVMADQVLSPVATFAQAERARLEFTMKEFSFANVMAYLQQAVDQGEGQLITFGSNNITVCPRSIVLVSEIPNCVSATMYTTVMLYQAYQSESAAMRFTRTGETLMKCTWVGISDPTRDDGDQLGQMVVEQGASGT